MKKRVVLLLLACCMLAGLSLLPVRAVDGRNALRTVRVGWDMVPGLQDGSSETALGGYNYEYLVQLAQYAGWKYEFVFGSWAELEQKLIDGELDLLGDVAYTDARAQKYSYCPYPNGYSHMLLACRLEDDRFAYNDYSRFDGLRVATIPSTFRRQLLDREGVQHGFTVQYLEYATQEEMFAALDSGEADAAIFSNVTRYKNYKILSQWEANPFYFVVPKDEPVLLEELTAAMRELNASDPFMEERLYSKYFGSNGEGALVAPSRDELAYVQRAGALRVLVYGGQEPLSYEKDGRLQGLVPAYCRLLAEKSGLRFVYVPCSSYGDMLRRFAAGEGDICAELREQGTDTARPAGLNLLRPYFTLSFGLVYNNVRSGALQRVAVRRDAAWLLGQLGSSGLSAVLYDTTQACAEAVRSGRVDAALVSSVEYEQLAHHARFSRLIFTLQPDLTQDLYLGVSQTQGRELFTLLSKVSGSVSERMLSDLLLANTDLKPQVSFEDYLNQNALLLACFLLLLALMFFSWIWVLRQRRNTRELQRANAEAERATRQTAAFFSNLSHDMRTPLTGIIGFTDLALEECRDASSRAYFEKIRASGSLLLELINDTLELSRIRSGKAVLRPEPVCCAELLHSVTNSVGAMAKKKRQTLHCTVELPPDERVLADRLKLQDVLMNLLSNAVKYTPEGGNIWLSVERCEPAGAVPRCRITVQDDGIGMSEDFLPRVFEPFEQEHAPEASGVSGSGLGLAIVKSIVQLMNGTITVHSARLKGSTFVVELPLEGSAPAPCAAGSPSPGAEGRPAAPEAVAPAEGGAAAPQSAAAEKSAAILAGRRVLLCEDNPVNTEILRRLLAARGIQAVHAPNGERGVQLFSESPAGTFDAVLMDVRMPVMDGCTATRAIRALSRPDAGLPILAMSADAYTEDVERCLAAGMDAHIAKPIDTARLFDTLARLLSR